MKDLTVDSHACHRAKSSDPSHTGHPSRPQRWAGDVAAGALSRLNFRSSTLQVALFTTGGSIFSQKLGRSQEIFLGSF